MKPPNLLFIFTDEQRADTCAAYGNPLIRTPNLNALAEQSVVFEKAYVTQSVCTPSRASIMTGLWPHTCGCTQNNVPLREETPCLPEMLPGGKYTCAYHGKWHLGDEIFPQHGFDEWRAIEDCYHGHYSPGRGEGRDRSARSHYYGWLVENGFAPENGTRFTRGETARFPEEYGKPAFLAGEATRFIREHAGGPWVLYVNFLEPHMPFFGPRDDEHDPAEVALPANFDDPPAEEEHLKSRMLKHYYERRGFGGHDLTTEKGWRDLIARYWGSVSHVDTYVGRMLAALEECGLAGDTIVVYTSDHGDMMGSHRLVAKTVPFEEAIRVPLMVRAPGTAARRVRGPVSQIDLVPTLLDLMGEKLPDHLEGTSLRPLVGGSQQEPGPADDVFFEWNGPNNGLGDKLSRVSLPEGLDKLGTRDELIAANTDPVRSIVTQDGWKFNWSAIGMHELYNLGDDPFETRNLAREPERKPLMRDLARRIHEWQARVGDEVELAGP